MKKVSQYSLLLCTCLFLVFIAGMFIGRGTDYSLSVQTESAIENSIPDELVIYSKEIYINGKLNINAAGKEDLTLLPGIGDTLSERIIAYREENGNFHDLDELLLVEGMGDGKLEKIKDYITVGSAG